MKRFLLFLMSCATLIVHAQTSKMNKTTQTKQNNNSKIVSTNSDSRKNNSSGNSDVVYNNIDVTKSEMIINSYRAKQFKTYPPVAAISWNNSLSNVALQFAKDIAREGDGSNIYTTKSGKSILNYPVLMGFTGGSVFFAVAVLYPDKTGEKTIIDAAFSDNNNLVVSNLMSSQAKKFGIGKYNNRWYIIYST